MINERSTAEQKIRILHEADHPGRTILGPAKAQERIRLPAPPVGLVGNGF